MPSPDTYDVVVIGGGTAGAAAAWRFAAAGRSVALVEQQALDAAGARWVNGVPPWQLAAAAVPLPEPPERRERETCLRVHGPSGRRGVVVAPPPLLTMDMRALVARLQGYARAAGATLLGGLQLADVTIEGGRPTAVRAVPTIGPPTAGRGAGRTLRARLFVDASGLRGALLRRVPALAAACPPLPASDLCVAAHEVAAVADTGAARAFLARHGAAPGDILAWTGVAGGFSVVQVHLSTDLGEADLLTGVIVDARQPSARELAARFRAEHPWLGAVRFGGGGHIPLRRPYSRLAAPGVALLGNAGCMVFPAHASGVGAGLVAARLLAAETLAADPADPGSARAVWAFQRAFHAGLGAVHHAYDVFRRMTQAMSAADTDALFESGLITPGTSGAALDSRLPLPSPVELLSLLRGAAREPRSAARMAAALARMPAVFAWARQHPRRPDDAALRRWARGLAALQGVTPDPL
jgi:flavin-dependent dehydrogenase